MSGTGKNAISKINPSESFCRVYKAIAVPTPIHASVVSLQRVPALNRQFFPGARAAYFSYRLCPGLPR